MNIAALDIGGANLKAVHTSGAAQFVPFEVWRQPGLICEAVQAVLRRFPPYDFLAVTMTAELCDCFSTKRDGVLRILDAVEAASSAISPGKAIKVFRLDGRLADLEQARAEPLAVASANWMALAVYGASLMTKGRCVVADTGSTTTEIIPVRNGVPLPGGRTDAERLLIGELVYTGVRRTPVFAISDRLPYHDRSCPVASEVFATMLDAYLLSADISEEAVPALPFTGAQVPGAVPVEQGGEASAAVPFHATADGRAATRAQARDRLARMVCADRETFDDEDALAAARFLVSAQEKKVRQALLLVAERIGGPFEKAVVAGEGEFLLRRAIHRLWPRCEIIPISERMSRDISRTACAYSLTRIAEDPAKFQRQLAK